MLALLLATVALAEPHTDAAATLAGGYVGFAPGVAARGSLTAANWGWGHVDGLVATRAFEGEEGRPYRRLGVEAGFTPPTLRGVAGVAVAVDRAWDEPACGPWCGGSPYTGWGVGAVWATHGDNADFEAFLGGGSYMNVDVLMPVWRIRLAWTLKDHVRVGFGSNGIESAYAEVGVAL
jgi:hypothetical protein